MKRTLLSAIPLLALCGCALQQIQTKITVGNATLVLPKNSKFDYLRAEIPTTNGPISLVVSNGSFVNEPAVINAATAHDVSIINATGNAAATAVGAVAGAGAKGAVAP